jgi:hypothetical protein
MHPWTPGSPDFTVSSMADDMGGVGPELHHLGYGDTWPS